MYRQAIGLMCLITAACGSGGSGGGFEEDLDPDVVTNLPAGDGTGTGATGDFDVELVITSCAGDCILDGADEGELDGDAMAICDVGTEQNQMAHVEQNAGALDVDVDDSEYVSQLRGGINSDGSFEVGGYITQNGGEVAATSRETGTIAGTTLTGTGRLQIRGSSLDCLIGFELTGFRVVTEKQYRHKKGADLGSVFK